VKFDSNGKRIADQYRIFQFKVDSGSLRENLVAITTCEKSGVDCVFSHLEGINDTMMWPCEFK